MSIKKHQTVEPASGNTEPASTVTADESAPTRVQALRANGGGGRKVLATAHINRAGGKLSPGDEFEIAESEEARLKGCFKEV